MPAQEKPCFKNWPKEIPKQIDYPKVALSEILDRTAKECPNAPAISFPNGEITYKELSDFSSQFASGLAEIGIQKGDRVAIFLPNIPQFIIAYYGILKAGATLTAISPLHREREVEYQLINSEAEAIVALDSLFPIVETVRSKTLLKHVIIASPGNSSNELPTQKPREQIPNIHNFQHFLKKDFPQKPKTNSNPSGDIAALQYTGGTTGTPKAAMLTHANLISNAIAFATWIGGTYGKETFLTALPLFHIYGMTTSMNVPICMGAKIVLAPKFEPLKVLETIQKHKVTVFCGVPTMYQALLGCPEIGKYDLTSIRVCISGASPLPPQVQRKFMEITGGLLAEGYGLSEASPVTHCSPVDKTMKTVRVGSIGLPLPDTEAKILDAETGMKTLKVGETGELAVRGPQIMKGYWKSPDETNLVLRDGWLLTGDIARMDSEGYFYITDRKKDLIKYKDYSVYPREIEDVLYEHPAVQLCAVIGKPDSSFGEIPKAFIVLKEGAKATAEEIMDFVKKQVAPYKALREVEFRKELPISSAGKPLRRKLREEEKQAINK